MKKILSTLVISCFSLLLWAQSSVFVIVDVSGSGPYAAIKAEAEQITRDLVLGTYNGGVSSNWKWFNAEPPIQQIVEGKGQPLIDPNQDGYLMIMPCGNKNRYREYKIRRIGQPSLEINNFFDTYYPNVFQDQTTFIDIARAKAASIAKGNNVNIGSYYLIEVSDRLFDTGSRAPNYDQIEKDILSSYGSSEASETKIATLRYEGDSKNYQIVVSRVDVNTTTVTPTPVDTNNAAVKEITIIRPNSTTKSKPSKIEGDQLQVIWKCLGCPPNTTYTVKATFKGSKRGVRPVVKRTTNTSVSLSLKEAGKYQLFVSTDGARAKPVFVETKSGGGGGGFLLLLLLAAIGAGVYYYLNQQNRVASNEEDGATRSNINRRTNRKPTTADAVDDELF